MHLLLLLFQVSPRPMVLVGKDDPPPSSPWDPLSFYPFHSLTLHHVPNPGFPFHKLPKKGRINQIEAALEQRVQKKKKTASGVRRGSETVGGWQRAGMVMHAALGFLVGGSPLFLELCEGLGGEGVSQRREVGSLAGAMWLPAQAVTGR